MIMNAYIYFHVYVYAFAHLFTHIHTGSVPVTGFIGWCNLCLLQINNAIWCLSSSAATSLVIFCLLHTSRPKTVPAILVGVSNSCGAQNSGSSVVRIPVQVELKEYTLVAKTNDQC